MAVYKNEIADGVIIAITPNNIAGGYDVAAIVYGGQVAEKHEKTMERARTTANRWARDFLK